MIRRLFQELSNAFFPENYTCELCGTEIFDGGRLCDRCAKTVTFNDGLTCPICGRRVQVKGACLECKYSSPAYERAVSALVYRDGGAALVLKFKRNNAYLKNYFADLLTLKCKTLKNIDAICYIPMTVKSERRRGYNQAKLLAYELGKRLDLPVLDGALIKLKDTKEQKTLSRKEREENLTGVFRADRKTVEGKTLLLVDDVMTTGATAEAAVKQLRKRGATKVYFASVASVEYQTKLTDDNDE